jgi:hypothetical protein
MRVAGNDGEGERSPVAAPIRSGDGVGEDEEDDEKAMASCRDWDGDENDVVGEENEGVGDAAAKAESGVGVEILRPLRLGLRVCRDTNESLRAIVVGPWPGALPLPPRPLPPLVAACADDDDADDDAGVCRLNSDGTSFSLITRTRMSTRTRTSSVNDSVIKARTRRSCP